MLDIFKPQNVRALEVKYELVPYTKGVVLDLGCGPWKTYPHFIGIDLCQNWPPHIPWRPDIVADCRSLSMFAGQSVDAVFSSHLLNELDDRAAVLKEWWRVIKPGGHLVLYLPYGDLSEKGVVHSMEAIPGGWDLVVNEVKPDHNSFLQVYRKRSDKAKRYPYRDLKPEKMCAVVRYGGAGDMIQTSSVLPELKKQGYHVTLYTSEGGYEVIKADPHVDEFVVQQREQVPNRELGEYWGVLKGKYTKFVNLSESVEGSLLAMEGRTIFAWPHGARHKVLNFNYLEIMHDIAEVPFQIHTRFYATKQEIKWAKRQRKMPYNLLWVLSGSSVHKAWPYMDQIIARLLIERNDVAIVLSGDELSQMLETGWENEPRVIKTSGKWSMRQTMAFGCHAADLVIGPETGVLNAVSMLDIPKIICLSHSSVENLTRDWVNTISLTPEGCTCYPCHRMQHGFTHCSRDEETGVAECQAKITPEAVWDAIERSFKWHRPALQIIR